MALVRQNNRGFTLVEVMLAMTILLIVFMALMQTALVGINSNMSNVLRDEAAKVAETRMNEAWSTPFDQVIDDATAFPGPSGCAGLTGLANGTVVTKNFRNVTNLTYCTNMNITALGTDKKQVDVLVQWQWKTETPTVTMTSIRRNME